MSCITNDLELVIDRLNVGEVVAIPTETVYGLAADAFSTSAIRKVFSIKKRPIDHPLIMHIAPEWDLSEWVSFIPDHAYALMESFWPGPLTLILPIKPGAINPLVTGGQNTIAIRAPKHALVQDLLLHVQKPLVAPSANPFGKISPTTALHVQHSFPEDDFLILDGGRCHVGIESTIVNVSQPFIYHILRYGTIDEKLIEKTISFKAHSGATNIRAPGRLLSHYEPEKTLYYVDDLASFPHALEKAYVLTFSKNQHLPCMSFYEFPDNSKDAAYEFYHQLRVADQSSADFIVMDLPPKANEWFAIREKILKAGKAI